jgi:hypothetical protein
MAIPRTTVARFRGLAVLGLTLIGRTAALAASKQVNAFCPGAAS